MHYESLNTALIDTLFRQHIKFCIYMLPGKKQTPFLFVDDDESPLLSEIEVFVVPWFAKFNDRIIIRDRKINAKFMAKPVEDHNLHASPINKQDYIADITALVEELKTTGGKTVISRVITGTWHDPKIAEIADQYFKGNEQTHRFLFYTPQTGCWLIATPEILLDGVEDLDFMTMALAGTRSVDEHAKPWSRKNIDEQAMVSRFIRDTLAENGLAYQMQDLKTIKAGAVEHLCTEFEVTIKNATAIPALLDSLSPTPALCGYPRDASVTRISKIEKHERGLYGGYIGIYSDAQNLIETFNACVVLRCAKLTPQGWCVFVGGGITAASDPEDEWHETELKSQRLVNILSKFK